MQSIKDNPDFAEDPTFFTDQGLPKAKLSKVSGGGIGTASKIASTAARSTDGLNDWYYQLHMGLSYRLLSKEDKKPKIETLKEKESKKN
jgi:hypothetical protein